MEWQGYLVEISPSQQFLSDLDLVYASLRAPAYSSMFLSGLADVYSTLPIASEANLHFLAERFSEWRRKTREFVNDRIGDLDKDDPMRCRISLFRTMDLGRLETAHTRTLAWLLDPTREHGFGNRLIAALMAKVSGRANVEGLRVGRVESEVAISSGRLDVFAKGEWEDGSSRKWVLVIEAKVGAPESDGQLGKYDDWLDIHAADHEIFRIFLSPDGRAPETSEMEWQALSYLELMLSFRTVYDKLRDKAGFHFLKFYMAGVFQDVCRIPCVEIGEAADPYPVADYLKSVLEPLNPTLKGTSHDPTRQISRVQS